MKVPNKCIAEIQTARVCVCWWGVGVGGGGVFELVRKKIPVLVYLGIKDHNPST